MDGFFSKALDALEPLQSKALSAIEETLNEFPERSAQAAQAEQPQTPAEVGGTATTGGAGAAGAVGMSSSPSVSEIIKASPRAIRDQDAAAFSSAAGDKLGIMPVGGVAAAAAAGGGGGGGGGRGSGGGGGRREGFSSDSSTTFTPSAIAASQDVLLFWETVDIEEKKSAWDATGIQITQNQESSAKSRKQLAEQTRAYRAAGSDKRGTAEVAPLLKSYQAEIDSLTKRAKFAESAFFAVYRLLYDAPDVVPTLRSLLELGSRVSSAEQDAWRYKQELEIVKVEAAGAKGLHATVRRLEERNAEIESHVQEKIDQAVFQKQKEMEKAMELGKARERAQQQQLEDARESIISLQTLLDKTQSQLFDLQARTEGERAAQQHDFEMVTQEVERAQERIRSLESTKVEMEAEIENMKTLLRNAATGTADVDEWQGEQSGMREERVVELERTLKEKDEVVSDLHCKMQQLVQTLEAEKERHRAEEQQLADNLASEQVLSQQLRAEMAEKPSQEQADELRRQVKMLKTLTGTDEDYWDKADGQSKREGGGGRGMDHERGSTAEAQEVRIQVALKETNRKLMSELMSAKASLSERLQDLQVEKGKRGLLEKKVEELQALVRKLEDDIWKGSASVRDNAESWSTSVITGFSDSGQKDDPRSDGLSSADGEKTMLEIVCAQRERFRTRMKALEEENGMLHKTAGKCEKEIECLKQDNISLYEKIKFLELYNKQQLAIRSMVGAGPGQPHVVAINSASRQKAMRYACFGVGQEVIPGDVGAAAVSGTEMRYRKLYEEKINPFAEFHQKEPELSYKKLRLHDKITLRSGRFFLSNKYARTFIFFYTILLHVLVFFILYKFSSCSNMARANSLSANLHPVLTGNPRSSSTLASPIGDLVGRNSTIPTAANSVVDTLAEKVGSFMERTKGIADKPPVKR